MDTQDGAMRNLSEHPNQKNEEQTTFIGTNLDKETMDALTLYLEENVNVFAWKSANMLGIDPNIFCHNFAINPYVKPVCQRRRKMAPKPLEEIKKKNK